MALFTDNAVYINWTTVQRYFWRNNRDPTVILVPFQLPPTLKKNIFARRWTWAEEEEAECRLHRILPLHQNLLFLYEGRSRQRHLTEDCAQVWVKTPWWSFYLVWRPSWQEIPGSYHVLSPPSPNNRLLLVITVIKPSFYWLPQRPDQFPILFSLPVGPGKTPFC
jgi:hypothetical protein